MPTLFTPMEGDQDHQSDDDHSDQHLFNPRSSSLTCTIFFKSSQDQGASTDDDHDQQKIKDEQLLPYQSNMNKNSDIVKHSREEEDRKKPTKWMSSKMRFMRKMMNPHNIIPNRRRRRKTIEFGVDQQTNQDSTVIRVCSDCHTTKTPLWRTGPQGPKSLCNACGIRQRKARRVIAAGTVGLDTGMIPADTWNEVEKQQKRSNVDETLPFKKRCKIISSQDQTDKKKHCFDLSKSSANLHSVLPQDERDAAILLMALSYGLICS